MSTDFFLPCNLCIHKEDHIHPAPNLRHVPVVHRWAGGQGVQLDISPVLVNVSDDQLLIEHSSDFVPRSHLVRLGDLKAERGKGA